MHEHPALTTSWRVRQVQEFLQRVGVQRIAPNQFPLGQPTDSGDPLRKPTGFISNAPELLTSLDGRCFGKNGLCFRLQGGRHAECLRKEAQRVATCEGELCMVILRAHRNQLLADKPMRKGMIGVMPNEDGVILDSSSFTGDSSSPCPSEPTTPIDDDD